METKIILKNEEAEEFESYLKAVIGFLNESDKKEENDGMKVEKIETRKTDDEKSRYTLYMVTNYDKEFYGDKIKGMALDNLSSLYPMVGVSPSNLSVLPFLSIKLASILSSPFTVTSLPS